MMILGISGSPRKDDSSGTMTLVETVLESTGCDYELISLKRKAISGCVACLGCVKDNMCKVQDDLAPLREKIVEADAYVIGAPTYYATINGATHAFLERWFQFRHREGDTLWGKLAVAVGVGGTSGSFAADDIEKFMAYNFIETVAKVTGQGAASCYFCSHGETCKVGLPIALHGEGVKITEESIPDVTQRPEVMQAAVEAGKALGERLAEGHDRAAVTRKMQKIMMEKLSHSA